MRQRIVFVDDEPQVLAGLRRMLWDKREDWDLYFFTDSTGALELLERLPVDLIVTDVRMPGMDGPELLGVVRQRWPATIRMILSGHSDCDYVLRTVKPAHQFLSKPCSPGELKATISRVLHLADVFTDERLRAAIARIDCLPVLPSVLAELTDELRSPNASVKIMGQIVARDIGLATGILKLVNSSFFGLPCRVSSTEQAVVLLGTETLRVLVLSRYLFSRFDVRRYPGFDLDRLWRHCMGVARCARALAGFEGGGKSQKEVCFVAGLVHDMGKLVLASVCSDDYTRILAESEAHNSSIGQAELAALGVTHAEIGGYLLGLWGFDEAVVRAVTRHHEPRRAGGEPPLPVTLVHAANALEHEIVVINAHYAPHPLDETFLAAQGMLDHLERWRGVCRNVLQGDSVE